jgi:hypothetical protein
MQTITNGATSITLSANGQNRALDKTFSIDDSSDHNDRQHLQNDEHHEVHTNTTIEPNVPITKSTMIYVFCAALNSCNLGYDIGVSTNVSKLIQNDINITNTQREIWIGFINFWASKCINTIVV